MRTWPQIKSLRSRKIRKLEPCDRVKEWHKGSRTFLETTPHGHCGTSYENYERNCASAIQFTYEIMQHSRTSLSDVNIDKSSDNQNQIYEANMRLSLTGSEHLEPPTTVPRLPACLKTPPRGYEVERDGTTAQRWCTIGD